MIPFEELPWEFDPEDGHLTTANEPVVGPDCLHPFPGDWSAGFRAVRINELLEQLGDEVTVDDLAGLQADRENLAVGIPLDALRAAEVEGRTAEARSLLDGWDRQQDVDSAAGAYFQAVLRQVLLETFGDELRSMSVVNATAWNAAEGYEVTAVPSMRMLVDLGDLDASRWINLTGQSGHAFHRNYDDMVELWRTNRTVPMRSTADAVQAAAVDMLILEP